MHSQELVLFHHPHSRSAGVRILLEELQLPCQFELVNLQAEVKHAGLLAVNPLGKIPTLVANGAVVTEQVAIYQFLAELQPSAGLSPAAGEPLRGPYLRAMAFYGSSFEPAMIDKSLKRDSGGKVMSPYGDVAAVEGWVRAQLAVGPWFLGERYTAVDVLWGGALSWMTRFGLIEATPEIQAYLQRFEARPAVQAARAKDAALLASAAG